MQLGVVLSHFHFWRDEKLSELGFLFFFAVLFYGNVPAM